MRQISLKRAHRQGLHYFVLYNLVFFTAKVHHLEAFADLRQKTWRTQDLESVMSSTFVYYGSPAHLFPQSTVSL
jgi:hypothetical protein